MGFNNYQKVSSVWFLMLSLFGLYNESSVQIMLNILISLIVWTIILGDKK